MALVELQISPLPSHVRTARLVAVAAARRAGLDDELVDELRLAVGEACSRAVGLHAQHAPDALVRVTVSDDVTGLTLTVVDAGPAAGPVPEDPLEGLLAEDAPAGDDEMADPDVALAVLHGLVDDMTVEAEDRGTVVTLRWPLPFRASGPRSTVLS
ncbi:MAG: anti-sigma regulatory factor [Frankiales bacterium]|jgi:anti-sigma regulatory factor (Ser/Thr protein kinase)|nr:anti-sigma regulatory factor [Frankiales bacterium]